MAHRSRLSQAVSNSDLDRLDSLFEDQLPVLHLTPVWSEHIHLDMRDDDLCFIGMHEGQLVAWLKLPMRTPISFPVHMALPIADDDGMTVFEIRKIGPGTWLLNPSLNIPELLHAYIVFCEVPEPAPWE